MDKLFSRKITLLNQTTLDSLIEHDVLKNIQHFTEIGLKILDADFGFAWKINDDKSSYHLIYKSPDIPHEPELPRDKGGNFVAIKTMEPVFVENTSNETYEKKFDVSKYMKSYVVIPITYDINTYGNIIICYKDVHNFSEIDRQFSISLGNATAQSITIHNLLERDQKNMEIVKRNEEYKSKMKEEELRMGFMADAMHEIRTPLAVIKGNIDLASKPYKMISQTEALKSINTEVSHLMSILSELSVLTSKNSQNKQKIETKKIKLASFISKISKRWKILARNKNIVIKIKNIPQVSVLADEGYLNKLFTNLVKNAITYSKVKGNIHISGMIEENNVKIDIRDNGIGVSGDDLEKIFQRFYKVDKSRANFDEYRGTGLGLAIAKWIAEAHGGKITATSKLGEGSTFSVLLPCA